MDSIKFNQTSESTQLFPTLIQPLSFLSCFNFTRYSVIELLFIMESVPLLTLVTEIGVAFPANKNSLPEERQPSATIQSDLKTDACKELAVIFGRSGGQVSIVDTTVGEPLLSALCSR